MANRDVEQVLDTVARYFVGQRRILEKVLAGALANGHILFEDNPGLGKTLLVKVFSRALGLESRRIQFTPDMLPADIMGSKIWNPATRQFELFKGPIFTSLVLADEINRAPPKTQSALLEAMEERQVTVDGTRHPLGARFLVVATQNPIEFEGTYPLPEAQLDRFLLKLEVPLPDEASEAELIRRVDAGFRSTDLVAAGVTAVVDAAALETAQAEAARIRVDPVVIGYITAIVAATRTSPDVALGASPRGSIGLLLAAKALAAISGRDHVVPDDVKSLALPVLRHRLVRRPEAELAGVTEAAAVERALARVPVPR